MHDSALAIVAFLVACAIPLGVIALALWLGEP